MHQSDSKPHSSLNLNFKENYFEPNKNSLFNLWVDFNEFKEDEKSERDLIEKIFQNIPEVKEISNYFNFYQEIIDFSSKKTSEIPDLLKEVNNFYLDVSKVLNLKLTSESLEKPLTQSFTEIDQANLEYSKHLPDDLAILEKIKSNLLTLEKFSTHISLHTKKPDIYGCILSVLGGVNHKIDQLKNPKETAKEEKQTKEEAEEQEKNKKLITAFGEKTLMEEPKIPKSSIQFLEKLIVCKKTLKKLRDKKQKKDLNDILIKACDFLRTRDQAHFSSLCQNLNALLKGNKRAEHLIYDAISPLYLRLMSLKNEGNFTLPEALEEKSFFSFSSKPKIRHTPDLNVIYALTLRSMSTYLISQDNMSHAVFHAAHLKQGEKIITLKEALDEKATLTIDPRVGSVLKACGITPSNPLSMQDLILASALETALADSVLTSTNAYSHINEEIGLRSNQYSTQIKEAIKALFKEIEITQSIDLIDEKKSDTAGITYCVKHATYKKLNKKIEDELDESLFTRELLNIVSINGNLKKEIKNTLQEKPLDRQKLSGLVASLEALEHYRSCLSKPENTTIVKSDVKKLSQKINLLRKSDDSTQLSDEAVIEAVNKQYFSENLNKKTTSKSKSSGTHSSILAKLGKHTLTGTLGTGGVVFGSALIEGGLNSNPLQYFEKTPETGEIPDLVNTGDIHLNAYEAFGVALGLVAGGYLLTHVLFALFECCQKSSVKPIDASSSDKTAPNPP